MLKKKLLGAAAAATLGLAALLAAEPASAYVSVYAGPTYYAPHPSSCWHWSYRFGRWVNYCRTYSYRPYYAPYAYGYGPYYGGPSFGFSFGFGDGHHHHHH